MVMATALYRGVFSKLVDSDKTGTSSDINNYFSASSVREMSLHTSFKAKRLLEIMSRFSYIL